MSTDNLEVSWALYEAHITRPPKREVITRDLYELKLSIIVVEGWPPKLTITDFHRIPKNDVYF